MTMLYLVSSPRTVRAMSTYNVLETALAVAFIAIGLSCVASRIVCVWECACRLHLFIYIQAN